MVKIYFVSNSKVLKFVILPSGLSPGTQKFTKLTKPPLFILRMQGYTVAIYIDDIISRDQSFEECLLTMVEIITLFQKLNFVVHPDKSKFTPANIVEYLGFIKDKSLKYDKGNFNAIITLSEDALHAISWWKKNLFQVFKPIRSKN